MEASGQNVTGKIGARILEQRVAYRSGEKRRGAERSGEERRGAERSREEQRGAERSGTDRSR